MGMREIHSEQIPDTSNIPEFFVTDIHLEIIGSNVRLVAGARRHGQVVWLYSAVVPADILMGMGKECVASGQEAFNTSQLMDPRTPH